MAKVVRNATFEQLLSKAETSDDFEALESFYIENKPQYHSDLLKLIKKNDSHDIQRLAFLIKIYSPHIRDIDLDNNREHIIQTLIKMKWTQGLQYLLNIDPSLINVGALTIDIDPFGKEKIVEVEPLLFYAIEKIEQGADLNIIEILIKSHPKLTLTDTSGNTIYHALARSELSLDKIKKILLMLHAEDPEQKVLNIQNMRGATALHTAVLNDREDQNNLYDTLVTEGVDINLEDEMGRKAIRGQAPERMPRNFFKAPTATRNMMLTMGGHRKKLMSLSPIQLCAGLIGKDAKRSSNDEQSLLANTRMFANINELSRYLTTDKPDTPYPYVLNAIVISSSGDEVWHAFNVLFIVEEPKSMKAIVIDSMGYDEESRHSSFSAVLTDSLNNQNINLSCLQNTEPFQYTPVGCRLIATYLAGKLCKMDLMQAQALYDSLNARSNQENNTVPINAFPLFLGLLNISQSRNLITQSLKIDERSQEAQSQINKKGQTFAQRAALGEQFEFNPEFVDVPNRLQNKTLERKMIENRPIHLEHFLHMSDDEAIEKIAILLGVKEMCELEKKDWKSYMLEVIEHMDTWENFSQYSLTPSMEKPQASENESPAF